jgi:MFS family permease
LPANQHAAQPTVRLRHAIIVFIGNGLEFYDFVVFSFFAVYIAQTFYPSDNPIVGLLATLATFGAGFLTRPVGAMVIGSMGDRVGRKPAMLFSFSLMGIAIVGLSLTPSYTSIGVAAPVLVLCFRLLQGFALGGEVGPTTAFMAEAAPPARRGLYLSMQFLTQDCSVLVAGVVGVSLAAILSEEQLQVWGWRAAMLVGAVIVPFGLLARRSLPETLHSDGDAPLAPAISTDKLTLRAKLTPYAKLIGLVFVMLAAGAIGTYTTDYMTTYALTTLQLGAAVAFGFTVVSGSVYIIFDLLSGWLSDRYGRKPVMIIPSMLLLISILPCFWIISSVRNIWVLYGALAIMVALHALSNVPVLITVTESLPKSIRSGAVATVYAAAISVFGGSTQFIVTWLISFTGDSLAPAYYWLGAAAVGLIAMIFAEESAPARRTSRAETVGIDATSSATPAHQR